MTLPGRLQKGKKQTRLAIVLCFLLYVIGVLFYTHRLPSFTYIQHSTNPRLKQTSLNKPENVTVSGLVFYGRQSRVQIMKCYIERNMVDNGGWLDEVLWVVNTDKSDDLRYLEEIMASNPRYKKVHPEEIAATYTYKNIWKLLDRGKYYVKIDDDIVWIDDNAIPNLVTRKIQNPDDFVVSGNIINNPPLGFFHMRMGAIHPYFPERFKPLDTNITNEREHWKPSRHPSWNGPTQFKWELNNEPPSWEHHRWLRVPDDRSLYQTPAAELKYDVWGESYKNWAIASQMHMSLFENIEKNQLDLYKFEKPWVMFEDRIRINFMCIYSNDILDSDPENWPKDRGDEDMIVLDLPKKLRRSVVIQGNALAAHYQYMDQNKLETTDILPRYQSLATDRYCLGADAFWATGREMKQRSP
ncbi:hypothetical protein FLONG3_4686 [Fusarium longipes]|uniref:Uncharacterized protein n=1 Tax=Fusarium longipes TaxID=694270 RepID=A0A395SXG3_9HYPO|nr:hypothetical protein FLONG3_4686 [Fusarium longipes]